MGTIVECVPVGSAALMLGISRQRVYQLLEAGHLIGRKMGSTWLVSMSSVSRRHGEREGMKHGKRSGRNRVGFA